MNLNLSIKNGFTLIELTISMAIISIGLTGTIFALTTSSKYSADPMIQQQASSIAKSYIEEIIAQQFPTVVPCGTPPAGGRATYANSCDYHGLSDTGVRAQSGAAISTLSSYNVAVSINTGSAVLGGLTTGTEVIGITVTVSHNLLPSPLVINAYKTNY